MDAFAGVARDSLNSDVAAIRTPEQAAAARSRINASPLCCLFSH
jgi:hypothetical protein